MQKFKDFVFTVVFLIWLVGLTAVTVYSYWQTELLSRAFIRMAQANKISQTDMNKFASAVDRRLKTADAQIYNLQNPIAKKR